MDSQTLAAQRGASTEVIARCLLAWPPEGARVEAGTMNDWLAHRRVLVDQLAAELRAGFQAVAAFRAGDYLDSVERQETLAQRIVEHDTHMPALEGAGRRRAAAAELRAMNAELRRLADIQAALIELGGRSVRCFQRVWALNSASYELDPAIRRPPASEPPPPPPRGAKEN